MTGGSGFSVGGCLWRHKNARHFVHTAINFVKAGGKDRTILLDLAAPERGIVEQALGLATEAD